MRGAYRVSQEEKGKLRIETNEFYQKNYGMSRSELRVIAKRYGYITETRLGKVI
jgi:hypothetical protein